MPTKTESGGPDTSVPTYPFVHHIYNSVILAQARTSGRTKLDADIALQQRKAPDMPLITFSSRGPRLREDDNPWEAMRSSMTA
ncbi:hypothetical protein KL86PLE_30130 [uncultured Pleomorphomonas sp.]|uniref:Uncharacterized protein n=1 Tax=uncultured Pleomorphomonas sp. TaxID=442121 RepID=A0A212LDQ1_9HYPH|nr:hypothetical protein KL86PLE_30130 [uncultured Pleomorphomonas sp.]